MINKEFIRIDYNFFKRSESTGMTTFDRIGIEGFLLHTYLLIHKNRDGKVRTTLKITNNDFNKLTGFKDARTIKKFLLSLKTQKFLSCEELTKDTKINDVLLIKVREPKYINGFSMIATDLFFNELEHIGSLGFAIYCLLFKNHNIGFGGDTSVGFANPSEDFIKETLDVGLTQVKQTLKKLEKRKLIKIEAQPPVTFINKYGEEEIKYIPNHYIVKAKIDQDDKYYIGKIQ